MDSNGWALNVAFVISPGANVMDLAGPWEVFRDARTGHGDAHRGPYRLYTVSDRAEPVEATGGLTLTPGFTLRDALTPRVISVGAQCGSPAILAWLREQSRRVDVLMSVCTGAFELGRAGVLAGRRATTHHLYWAAFAEEFPEVTLVRGRRFVDDGDIVTAGGLTSGIDAALHVVARMLGDEAAERTAAYLEYDGDGWRTGERPTSDGPRARYGQQDRRSAHDPFGGVAATTSGAEIDESVVTIAVVEPIQERMWHRCYVVAATASPGSRAVRQFTAPRAFSLPR